VKLTRTDIIANRDRALETAVAFLQQKTAATKTAESMK
jgi:hypothetical protein